MRTLLKYLLLLVNLSIGLKGISQSFDTLIKVKNPVTADSLFYPNNRLLKVIVKNAEEDSTIYGYYETGNFKFIVNFDAQGRYNGYFITKFPTGQLSSIAYYDHAKLIGKGYSFFEDGDTMSIKECTLDSCLSIEYYPNGNVNRLTRFYHEKVSRTEAYYPNGKFKCIEYNNVSYSFVMYDSTGRKEFEVYKNPFGANVGPITFWDSLGYISILGNYSSNVQWQSKKEGEWLYFTREGKIYKTEIYEGGKLVKTKVFKKPKSGNKLKHSKDRKPKKLSSIVHNP